MNYRIGNAVCIDEMPDTGRGGQTFAKRTASDASPARAGAASDGIYPEIRCITPGDIQYRVL
ncbi:TPA: hypothetical protein ACFPSY_000350 [Neisseria meningitidis]